MIYHSTIRPGIGYKQIAPMARESADETIRTINKIITSDDSPLMSKKNLLEGIIKDNEATKMALYGKKTNAGRVQGNYVNQETTYLKKELAKTNAMLVPVNNGKAMLNRIG